MSNDLQNNPELDYLIEFEEESPTLDFKKEEYRKGQYGSLIKDVMAMANATTSETKRIIIGIKHKPGEDKDFVGIDTISDQSVFENIIHENIEPTINFKYYSYIFKGVKLGILEIFENNDRPYMMKKKYSEKHLQGDMWIRKGSRQSRIVRADLDNIYNKINKNFIFNNKIKLGFGENLDTTISIPKNSIKPNLLPSTRRKKEVERLISKLDEYCKTTPEKSNLFPTISPEFIYSNKSIRIGYNEFGLPIYKNKSQLERELNSVSKNYLKDDQYYIYEKNSYKFNCQIYNGGSEFLEDVKIELIFDSTIFTIADKIHEKPTSIFNRPAVHIDNYPHVYKKENFYIVEVEHPAIRHKDLTNVFDDDLRMIVRKQTTAKSVKIKYKINAKNLPTPIENSFYINITEKQEDWVSIFLFSYLY